MTCKDCIHSEVCKYRKRQILLSDCTCDKSNKIEKSGCPFADKSRFIELMCKVGDTVYVIGENDIAELEIKDIELNDTGEHYYAICKMHKICNCDYEIGDCCLVEEEICFISFTNYDFGRKSFLTKEEAKKAIKERENNE